MGSRWMVVAVFSAVLAQAPGCVNYPPQRDREEEERPGDRPDRGSQTGGSQDGHQHQH